MSLSRKHFEAVAEILRDERATNGRIRDDAGWNGAESAIDRIEDRLCVYFLSENPAFDAGRFRRASQP